MFEVYNVNFKNIDTTKSSHCNIFHSHNDVHLSFCNELIALLKIRSRYQRCKTLYSLIPLYLNWPYIKFTMLNVKHFQSTVKILFSRNMMLKIILKINLKSQCESNNFVRINIRIHSSNISKSPIAICKIYKTIFKHIKNFKYNFEYNDDLKFYV